MNFLTAGWSSLVARQAHNLKVAGSNPAPATLLRAAAFWALRFEGQALFFARRRPFVAQGCFQPQGVEGHTHHELRLLPPQSQEPKENLCWVH